MHNDNISNSYLRAALIVDGPELPKWAMDSLKIAIARKRIKIVAVYQCQNNLSPKKPFKNFVYYIIRTFFARPSAWIKQPLSTIIDDIDFFTFDALYEGIWQRIPDHVNRHAAAIGIDIVVKFGMGLLRDPQDFPAKYGIVSYHHGDPSAYRGRPAAFYEVYNDADYVGAVVQRLSNTLDAGEVLSSGRYRIERHSYKNTLESLYTGSSALLDKALVNHRFIFSNNFTVGVNYKLPKNIVAIRFLSRIFIRSVKRFFYGMFLNKEWRICVSKNPNQILSTGVSTLSGHKLEVPSGVEFMADSFWLDKDSESFVCERMSKGHVYGDLVRVSSDGSVTDLLLGYGRKHMSYPYVFYDQGKVFLLPEVADWSSPLLLCLSSSLDSVEEVIPIRGLENERILDPTMIKYDGLYWIFGSPNKCYRKMDTLMLWYSSNLTGPYVEHEMNPIVSDPLCARPAGPVELIDGILIRYGQNNTKHYGNGIVRSKITSLSTNSFAEERAGMIVCSENYGPHTIDVRNGNILYDCYLNRFSLTAWLLRLKRYIYLIKQ